jgi:hypothetical protein
MNASGLSAGQISGTISQSCTSQEYNDTCHSGWPANYLLDVPQLLLLKVQAGNDDTISKLDGWISDSPPCTTMANISSCALCMDPSSQQCGTTTGPGIWLCNWPFIECRDRRVVKINTFQQVCRDELMTAGWQQQQNAHDGQLELAVVSSSA